MEGSSPQGDPKTQKVLKKSRKSSWRASWGRHEISLLLEAILKTGKAHQIISGTSQRKSKLWREVTETLAESQVGYTAEQCRTKWKHLKTQFRFEEARYLTTGVHSDPLPHFYEKMSTLWTMAAKAAPPKRPKRPTRANQKQNKIEEMPAPLPEKHTYDPGPDKQEMPAPLPEKHTYDPGPNKQEVLPGMQSQPPQAETSIGEHQSKDNETNKALQQEKPAVPCDPRYQQIGEAMLEELRNLSRTQQEMSVVNMYIAKALQYQQEQLIPGIRLLNHNMYQLCLLMANQTEAPLHPGPFLPQMINPSILLSGSPGPQPFSSIFEPPPGGPQPN